MIEINLLPWREEKRQANQKQFTYLLLATVLLSFLITILCNFYSEGLARNQGIRNQLLQQEQSILNKELAEIKSLEVTVKSKMEKINSLTNLFNTSVIIVHLLEELPGLTPNGIYLTKLELDNNLVSIKGYSNSNSDIALMIHHLEQSPWLHKISLKNIVSLSSKQEEKGHEFLLTCILEQNMKNDL